MTLRTLIQRLKTEEENPCVTISLNTHRTHPDNAKDRILLKNLLDEATDRINKEFDKKEVKELLDKLETVQDEIDVNYNLDSLHLFLSNDTKEIVRLPWPIHQNMVHISTTFAVRPLIKAYTRIESYLLMMLSQGGVKLYEAVNDSIVGEIKNEKFPFPENPNFAFPEERKSDAEYMDDLVREFFNNVDKALVDVHTETSLNCVVVCTTDNYSRLLQVADKPSVYEGYVNIDYNKTAPHQMVQQTWELMKNHQKQRKANAIAEIKEAVSGGKVLTDLQEIYQAAIDGRGDLLIVHQDFAQPVMMTGDRTFNFIDDASTPGANDDISSDIAWEVLSKKGRVLFTTQDDIKELGEIVLKTRY